MPHPYRSSQPGPIRRLHAPSELLHTREMPLWGKVHVTPRPVCETAAAEEAAGRTIQSPCVLAVESWRPP